MVDGFGKWLNCPVHGDVPMTYLLFTIPMGHVSQAPRNNWVAVTWNESSKWSGLAHLDMGDVRWAKSIVMKFGKADYLMINPCVRTSTTGKASNLLSRHQKLIRYETDPV